MHAYSQKSTLPTWHQVLTGYVDFLSHAADDADARLQAVRSYYGSARYYRTNQSFGLRLVPTRTLNDYYYQTARKDNGRLAAAEIITLQSGAQRVWEALNTLDEKSKELETYVRLEDYKHDGLRGSDAMLGELEGLFEKFAREKENLWHQVEAIYGHYHPASSADPGLQLALAMRKVLDNEKALLDAWVLYLDENKPADWPVELVEKHIAESEKALARFAHVPADIQYPADDMVKSFRSALGDVLQLQRTALDEYNFEARQSAKHGNEVYLQMHNYFNNALLSFYSSFVSYSRPAYRLLNYPKAAPRFAITPPAPRKQERVRAKPFKDAPLLPFTTRRAAAPVTPTTLDALNHYIEFINESLRQISTWQVLLRNYAHNVSYHRGSRPGSRQAALAYSHKDVKLPHSYYGMLVLEGEAIPSAYRPSVLSQAEVLMNMLKEMDALSVELIGYTREKEYEQDQFKRSDEILARYDHLIGQFDDRKEQLYGDVRRIYESYPPQKADDSWYVAGQAMLRALDLDKALLFGVRDYLGGRESSLPDAAAVEAEGRKLIREEYKNMKGLERLGPNNGNCPYSYYETVAENSVRLARMTTEKMRNQNPYESYYYFYNNQLVYDYNRYTELAQPRQLKNINQLNRFVMDLTAPFGRPASPPDPVAVTARPGAKQPADPQPVTPPLQSRPDPHSGTPPAEPSVVRYVEEKRDTVYVERVDTVYVERGPEGTPVRSLEGYANNNLVLLLDVSASMNAPQKLPLLKKSVKSLLQLLRPTDQVSIVVYSGKAKVALEAVTGADVRKIEQAIDDLHSDGGTDGNAGIRLAYKLANRHYLRGGNNRIVLATDGEFPVGAEVQEVVEANAREDVFLTVFHFTPKHAASAMLQQMAQKGHGTYTHITPENADARLLSEAQAK
ncbi:MAG: VWA domain-containing protein, partial [Cytophagales bacterium]|nr:VWA domain-containing protein [Cytophagales bacterium]